MAFGIPEQGIGVRTAPPDLDRSIQAQIAGILGNKPFETGGRGLGGTPVAAAGGGGGGLGGFLSALQAGLSELPRSVSTPGLGIPGGGSTSQIAQLPQETGGGGTLGALIRSQGHLTQTALGLVSAYLGGSGNAPSTDASPQPAAQGGGGGGGAGATGGILAGLKL